MIYTSVACDLDACGKSIQMPAPDRLPQGWCMTVAPQIAWKWYEEPVPCHFCGYDHMRQHVADVDSTRRDAQ